MGVRAASNARAVGARGQCRFSSCEWIRSAHHPAYAMNPTGVRVRDLAARLAGAARDIFYFRRASHVYRISAEQAQSLPTSAMFARDDPAQLAKYAPDERWHPAPTAQNAVNHARLSAGHRVYTICDDTGLVHYSWLSINPGYLECDFGPERIALGGGHATLWHHTTVAARARLSHAGHRPPRTQMPLPSPALSGIYIGVMADKRALAT